MPAAFAIRRVVHVSPTTVLKEKKKEPALPHGNQAVLKPLSPEHVDMEIRRAEALAAASRDDVSARGDGEL